MPDTEKKKKKSMLELPDSHHGDNTDPLPPPYDDSGAPEALGELGESSSSASAGAGVAGDPPTYHDVSAADPRSNLASSDPPTLLLDGYTIHAESQPDRPLYELGLAPMTGRNGICGIEKVWYSVGADGEGRPKPRKRFIYELQIWPSVDHVFGHVEIVGKSSRSFSKMQLVGGAGWTSCKAEGHFKAQTSLSSRLFSRSGGSSGGGSGESKMVQVEWKDMEGKVVAWEEFPTKKDGSEPSELARLHVQAAMEDKELDALVACWMARIWKVRRSQTKEPLSWAMGESERHCTVFVFAHSLTSISQTTHLQQSNKGRRHLQHAQECVVLRFSLLNANHVNCHSCVVCDTSSVVVSSRPVVRVSGTG